MTEPEPLPPAADPFQPDTPVIPSAPQDYPTSPVVGPAQPAGPAYPAGPGQPPAGLPLAYAYPPPPPRKTGKALKIVLISLAAVFALCVSGGVTAVIWARNTAAQPTGADSPDQAAEAFLTAYYRSQDPVRAKKTVCAKARDDKAIAAQIADIKQYAGGYDKPTFTWNTPKVSNRTADRATVSVELTMTTEDLKAAQQQLTLDAVRDKGWWICAAHKQ